MFNNFFPRKKFTAEKYGRPKQTTDDDIIQRMRIRNWIANATNIHSEYIMLIAFPRHQLLHERATALSYAYTASLIIILNSCVCWFSGFLSYQ